MGNQRYERVAESDADSSPTSYSNQPIPSSPPPSFRSRASSPSSQRHNARGSVTRVDQTLADTFDDGQASDDEGENEGDDRQRLIRSNTQPVQEERVPQGLYQPRIQRRVGEQPTSAPPPAPAPSSRQSHPATFSSSNDGVFANLAAKPDLEKLEELPPSYEQAAADATPPYWETTLLTPGMVSDDVYVDGLPVGSLFSFVWNGIISMSFQLVGFLLTYLLHTTHAAKNGSRAGLGITLVQYGFYMRSSTSLGQGNPSDPQFGQPSDPNSHNFDPNDVSKSAAAAVGSMASSQGDTQVSVATSHNFFASEFIAYFLMIVGWFILIKSVTDFMKARRHEQLVLQSPDRGLNVPVVADGESTETVV